MAKKYNEIEAKDNMKVADDVEEVADAPKEKMKAVLSVQPQKVKRNLFNRFVSGVVGPEGLPGIGSYVNEEIIKPAFKSLVTDALHSAIDMMVYGKGGTGGRTPYRSGSVSRPGAHRPSTNYSTSYRSAPAEVERVAPRIRNSIPDFVIEDRLQASEVLVALQDAADRYDNVSVADYYDLIGVASEYTDNNHGWTFDSISRATLLTVRGGYIIKFPPVEVI